MWEPAVHCDGRLDVVTYIEEKKFGDCPFVTVRALLSYTAGMPLGSFGNEYDPGMETKQSY